ncbi:MAG: DEAD/DEAH box helicase, partial [Bacteroidota bacterium]
IEVIRDKKGFVIDWEKPGENIYLQDHDHLLLLLKQCRNVIGEDKQPINFESGEGHIKMEIDRNEDQMEAWTHLSFDGQSYESPEVLNEEHALVDNTIYPITPLGSNFINLRNFQTRFHSEDFAKYLSLLFSYLDHVRIQWQNYRTEFSTEIAVAEPSLVFEQVGNDHSLYMRVSQVLPKLGVHFLDDFEISKIAEINELEQVINVKTISQKPLEQLVGQMAKRLKRVQTQKGRGKQQVVQDENLFILPEETARLFIYNELPTMLTEYKIYGTEKLTSFKVKTVTPTLNVNLGWDIDFLEGEATLDIEGQQMNLFDVISQYNKNRYIPLNDGSHAIINEGYVRKLERIFKKKKDNVQVSFFDLPLVEELLAEKELDTTFQKSREIFEGFNSIAKSRGKLPKINAELRDYQKQGYRWLNYLHETGLGGCLADDMGLGKTLQAITILSKIYPKEKHPSLIIMPRSLLFNWESEVSKFNPELSVYRYYEANRDMEEAKKHHLILTTYALVRNDIEKFKDQNFHYIILDESQNIKNIASQSHKAVMLLQSKHRLALSGTPIENNLGELYALFHFLNPSMFGTAQSFNNHYATPIQKDNNEKVITELRKKIYPFILRRLKKNVLKELPNKTEQVLYVEMSEPQRKFYEQRRQFYQDAIKTQIATKGVQQSQFFIFQALTELRQIACTPEARTEGKIVSPKRELLIEQVIHAIANGHKVLIFANFLNAIELIGEQLDSEGVDYVSMTGSTRDRQRLVERFQEDDECKAFLMTLKTGGLGLNLTAADMIFIFDPWWNKSAENQAIDRAHRMGQTKKVICYKLIAQDTIEEKILLLQNRKSELFDSVISSDTSSVKSLSEEDIDFILG